MTLGLQVDNRHLFTSLLQTYFNDIAIINIAKSGCGPIFYNKILQNFLITERIHPNVTKIFYFVYMGNDFDNLFEEEEDTKFKRFIKRYFYRVRTYHLLRIIYFQLRYRITDLNKSLFQKDTVESDASPITSKSSNSPINNEQQENLPFYAYPNQKSEQARAILDTTLHNAKKMADMYRVELIVVSLPSVKQIQARKHHALYTYPISLLAPQHRKTDAAIKRKLTQFHRSRDYQKI